MKKNLSIVLLLLMAMSRTGICQQSLSTTPIPDDFSLGYTKIVGKTETGYFMQSGNLGYEITNEKTGFKSPKYKLGFFNKSLELVWSKNLEGTTQGSKLVDLFFQGEQVWVLSSLWDNSQRSLTISCSVWDSIGNPSESHELIKMEGILQEPFDIGASISLHKEAISVYALSKGTEDSLHLTIATFNDAFELIQESSANMNQPWKSFNIQGMVVSDSGRAVLIGLHSEKTKTLSSKRENSWYAYRSSKNDIVEVPIGQGLELSSMDMTLDEFKQEAIVSGFYSDKDSYVGAGILTCKLGVGPMNDTTVTCLRSVIDANQNLRLKGLRNAGESGGLNGYPIRKTIPRGDGGLVLIAESSFTSEYSYFDSFSQTFTRRLEYNFGDIVMFSIDANGTIQWSSSIQKDQVSMDDGGIFSSYCMMIESHRLNFLFSEPIGKRSKILKGSVAHNGVPDKTMPLSLPEGTLLLTGGAKQVAQDELVIPVLLKRKLHLLRLLF